MLCLAPTELVTDAERRLFHALTALGSGTTVFGGLAVFVPVVDGVMQRRQADAVCFLPETVVVVRAVAMGGRQSGELRPRPDGVWTIGGEPLRLSGGGASPATQLRKAVQLVHATLEAGGLDPGSPPGLAAIDGAISSVRDRSAGGPVACSLDAGEVLTGLRHCAGVGSRADRRVWTTADVRAALAIFGLQGRGPSVEELNNEGFLYSPYVLRRPQAAAHSRSQPVEARIGTGPRAAGPRTGGGVATALPVTDASSPELDLPSPTADSAPMDRVLPDGAVEESDASDASDPSGRPPNTDGTGRDVDLSGLFADEATPAPPDDPERRAVRSAPAAARGPTPTTPQRRSRRRRAPWLMIGAIALVLIAGVAGLLYVFASGLGDGPADAGATGTSTSSSTTTAAEPTAAPTSPTQVVDDATFTLAASRADVDCAGNAYGQVADYFTGTPCTGLTRALFTVTLDGLPAVVSVSDVQMPDEATAGEFRTLVDSSGTGNVSDLLRSGVPLEGGPSELVAGAYASELTGAVVRIVEVAWVDAEGVGSDATLDAAAAAALTLQVPVV